MPPSFVDVTIILRRFMILVNADGSITWIIGPQARRNCFGIPDHTECRVGRLVLRSAAEFFRASQRTGAPCGRSRPLFEASGVPSGPWEALRSQGGLAEDSDASQRAQAGHGGFERLAEVSGTPRNRPLPSRDWPRLEEGPRRPREHSDATQNLRSPHRRFRQLAESSR